MKRFVWCLLLGCSACLQMWAAAVWAGDQALTDLLLACHAGDCPAVRACLHDNRELARQAVITDQSEQGYTALDVAARGGYAEIVRLLALAGADVNSRSGAAVRTPLLQVCRHAFDKSTELPADLVKALSLPDLPTAVQSSPPGPAAPACARDYLHCLRLLINSGADLDATDKQGRGALYFCAWLGNREALCVLIKHGATLSGWTLDNNEPLNAAAFKGHLACVQALVSAGAPMTTGKKHGYSALNYAGGKGHVEIVQYLMQQGMSVNAQSTPSGGTPLLVASETGQLVYMQILLDAGADINRPDEDGHTALYCAAQEGQLAALELLLAAGARVHGCSSSKTDPLYAAALNGHTDCVRALVAAGAAIITGRKHGCSALNGAAQNGHVEILQYLLQQGVSVNADSSPSAGTPLLVASENGQLACMQLLLAAGAKVNRSDCRSHTALYCAASSGQLAAVNDLLLQGAAVDCRTCTGETPLSVACRNGYGAVVAALLKVGAQPEMLVRKQTPLYIAAMGGHVETVEHLLAAGADPLQQSNMSLLCRGHSPGHIAQKKCDSATEADERERYAAIVQRLQQCSIEQRRRRTDIAITEKTPLLG